MRVFTISLHQEEHIITTHIGSLSCLKGSIGLQSRIKHLIPPFFIDDWHTHTIANN
jgi:hypothetical protein